QIRIEPPGLRPLPLQGGFPQAEAGGFTAGLSLSKKWRKPLFRGFHSSLAPTARPGSYAGKPLLRKAFCGFDAHVAKSDCSLWGLRPPNPRGFFDSLRPAVSPPASVCRETRLCVRHTPGLGHVAAKGGEYRESQGSPGTATWPVF